jgi:probable rRNA maturation factor
MTDQPRPTLGARRLVGGDGDAEVFVADEQDEYRVDVERWRDLAADVLRAEGVRGGTELSLLFVSESEIAALNMQFLDTSGPTDVLAFPIDADSIVEGPGSNHAYTGPDRPARDTDDMPLLLGDVVICPSVAVRNAPDHAGTIDDELALLVVHGVLHVLGHDHADEDETRVMRARERELLETFHWRGPPPTQFRHGDEP